jgi:hypothetical protein
MHLQVHTLCTLGCTTSQHYKGMVYEYGTVLRGVSLHCSPSFWALPTDLVSQLCTGKSDTTVFLGVVSTVVWEDDTS